MNLAELSIRRPIFISCLVILLLIVGVMALKKLPVDVFPDVTFPVLLVNTNYEGASPEEVEALISKVIENELNNIPGIKQLNSDSTEGRSQVVVQFTNETDMNYAEQQVRDRIAAAKKKLPEAADEPSIKRMDPADKPVLILAIQGNLPKLALYELADKTIKPKLEQINQVGMVETLGSSGREIHVDLNRDKLTQYNLSATQVAHSIGTAGQNTPIGKIDQGKQEKMFRAIGEYASLKDIGAVVLNFFGSDVPVKVSDVAKITDATTDEQSKSYVNGQPALLLMLFRQTGSNTIEVVEKVNKKIVALNAELKAQHLPVTIEAVRDSSKMISANVDDVKESILIGILLTILVVYLFLGSGRSTFITGLALPTSLIGSFLLMHLAGFSINTMSLLALSLAVGLLVDDAIVVRENIFRHAELGKTPIRAAIDGTKEVLLAVIATSLTVMAVFGPIGFLHGIVGSFFKEFGLTVCFAMVISLLDALTIAPMLSAYIGMGRHAKQNRVLKLFQQFQSWLETSYEKVLNFALRYPLAILGGALLIFILSLVMAKYVPKTFLPAQDMGEFMISVELPPGATLSAMDQMTKQIDTRLRTYPEIATAVAVVGSRGEPNKARFFVNMVPAKERALNTTQFKAKVRAQLKQQFKGVKIAVRDIDLVGGGDRPFNLVLRGDNLEELKTVAFKVFQILKANKGLLDPEISYKSGKPELQIVPDKMALQKLGVLNNILGQELRTQIAGTTPAVFHENGQEYDIRVRVQPDQRDLEHNFQKILIPNVNNQLVHLSDVAKPIASLAPATINRQDRSKYINIAADLAANGSGMGGITEEINQLFETQIKLPAGISYSFQGQAESFQELGQNMVIAISLGIVFIYLVLASLYESFVIPFTIMLVLPLATCGAFFALLITAHSLDIFSMIGCIMLFGLATKNSILLVDYTRQLTAEGMARKEAIIQAGLTRLRPILMTTIALIAGMLPIAIGLNEASKQRTSMGIAVIGGLISSTLLTLVVVPAAYSYMDRFRLWCRKILTRKHPATPEEDTTVTALNDLG
jgi:HAE1 family hydrophobic/amphiphilic exporter-1